jgi:transcriptional regulator with XRE-family HTH domain
MTVKKRAPDPYDIEIGRRVRALRVARRMSQAELGARLGITFQQIQKYERGANRVSAGRLQYIAQVFAVPMSSLLGADDNNAENNRDVLEFMNAPDAVRLLQAYSRIKDRKLRLVLLHLTSLIAETCAIEPV